MKQEFLDLSVQYRVNLGCCLASNCIALIHPWVKYGSVTGKSPAGSGKNEASMMPGR